MIIQSKIRKPGQLELTAGLKERTIPFMFGAHKAHVSLPYVSAHIKPNTYVRLLSRAIVKLKALQKCPQIKGLIAQFVIQSPPSPKASK